MQHLLGGVWIELVLEKLCVAHHTWFRRLHGHFGQEVAEILLLEAVLYVEVFCYLQVSSDAYVAFNLQICKLLVNWSLIGVLWELERVQVERLVLRVVLVHLCYKRLQLLGELLLKLLLLGCELLLQLLPKPEIGYQNDCFLAVQAALVVGDSLRLLHRLLALLLLSRELRSQAVHVALDQIHFVVQMHRLRLLELRNLIQLVQIKIIQTRNILLHYY